MLRGSVTRGKASAYAVGGVVVGSSPTLHAKYMCGRVAIGSCLQNSNGVTT